MIRYAWQQLKGLASSNQGLQIGPPGTQLADFSMLMRWNLGVKPRFLGHVSLIGKSAAYLQMHVVEHLSNRVSRILEQHCAHIENVWFWTSDRLLFSYQLSDMPHTFGTDEASPSQGAFLIP
jgi:hypothetical protein